jgi:hypothetical protein
VNYYRYDVVKKKLRSKPICDIDHVLHMCTDRILDSVAASVMLLLFRVDRSSSCAVPRSLFQEFPVVTTIPAVSNQPQLRVKAKQRAVPDKGEACWEVESEEEEAGEEKPEARHRSRTSAPDKEKSTMKSCGNNKKRKRPKDCDDDSKGTIKITR